MARHPEDVPEASTFVLETAVALRKGDQAVPDGARDRDGDVETGFARGVGDVDEDAVIDRLGAGVAITTPCARTAAWDTGRRHQRRSSCQAGRPAPLRYAGRPASLAEKPAMH